MNLTFNRRISNFVFQDLNIAWPILYTTHHSIFACIELASIRSTQVHESTDNRIPPTASLKMSYYDIDAILTDAQKVPCTFELEIPGLGYLDDNAGGDVSAPPPPIPSLPSYRPAS